MESEGDLLQEMLDTLGPEDCYKLGKIMGIMAKGDATRIATLERHVNSLKEQVRVVTIAMNDAEEEIRRRIEQERAG
jgi:hypothetical protein